MGNYLPYIEIDLFRARRIVEDKTGTEREKLIRDIMDLVKDFEGV
jgi:hypothetical protein